MPTSIPNPEVFLTEYSSQDAILKYTKATAGYGISYLLEHDYKTVYFEALKLLPQSILGKGLRILEFGCGGGMNLLHLVSTLENQGQRVEAAVGTDFSSALIDSAKQEARQYATPAQQKKISFYVAKNETLVDDLALAVGKPAADLKGSFHLIVGVNTIRYCHRLGKEIECANALRDLLAPGGVCVVIDMNNRFPAFRSAVRDRLRKEKGEYYLPSLQEYTAPFSKTGFQVVRSEHFCWIPHSAGPAMCGLLRTVSPVLDMLAKSRAMRSLVVAQKPNN